MWLPLQLEISSYQDLSHHCLQTCVLFAFCNGFQLKSVSVDAYLLLWFQSFLLECGVTLNFGDVVVQYFLLYSQINRLQRFGPCSFTFQFYRYIVEDNALDNFCSLKQLVFFHLKIYGFSSLLATGAFFSLVYWI